MVEWDTELDVIWTNFEQVLNANAFIFSNYFMDKKTFVNMYRIVCTRCFSYGR